MKTPNRPGIDRRTLMKYSATATAATVAGAGLTGPGRALAQEPVPAAEQVLNYTWQFDIRSQDPANALEVNGLQVVRAAYEGLVGQVTGTTEIAPALASEWTFAEDARSVVFNLREGVKFHDGTTLDAEAVKKSYDRVIAMNLGPASLLSSVEEVRVIDPLTVEIVLATPNVYFLTYVPKIGIISPTAWESNQVDGDYGAAWLEQNTAGTGPYRVTEIIPNQRRVLERFEDYWQGWEGNHLTRINFDIVPEAETRRQMLLNGEAQMIGSLPSETVQAIEGEEGVVVNVSPSFEIDIITFNMRKAPFDDVRVRRAAQLAFDYQGYLDGVLLGFGRVPNGPLAPEFTGANTELPVFAQNLEQAKALIDEAGVAGQTVTMNYVDFLPIEQSAALIVQDTLGQIGLNVEIRPLPWATMYEIAGDLELADHMSILLGSVFTADPIFNLSQSFGVEFAGKPYNWSWYVNEEMQALLDEAAQTFDEATRLDLIRQAQAIIVDDAPVIFYANPLAVEPVSDRVQNYIWNPVDYYFQVAWYEVWLSE